MAGIARRSARMLNGIYLRKTLGLGEIGLVATRAEHRGVQLVRHHGSRIVDVLGLWPMTGLAGHAFVHTLVLHIDDVAMAGLAGLMTGVGDGQSCNFSYRIRPVMPVATEAARHQKIPQHHERDEPYQKNCRHTEEVTRIFERFHWLCPQETARSPGLGSFIFLPMPPEENASNPCARDIGHTRPMTRCSSSQAVVTSVTCLLRVGEGQTLSTESGARPCAGIPQSTMGHDYPTSPRMSNRSLSSRISNRDPSPTVGSMGTRDQALSAKWWRDVGRR